MLLTPITRIFDALAQIATLFLLSIVALNIVSRQIHTLTSGDINVMIPGAIELSKFTLLFIVFAALPRATTHGMVRVDLLANQFPKAFRYFLEKLWMVLIAGFTAALAWLFINKTLLTFSRGDATQDLQMPLFYFYAIIALASIATTLSCLSKVFNQQDNT